jgi:hypothetical protein
LDESGGGTGIDFNLNIENTDVNFDREDEAALNWPSNKICFFFSNLWDALELSGTKVL